MSDLIKYESNVKVSEILNCTDLSEILNESEIDFSNYTKIPFSRLTAMGAPLTQTVQTIIDKSGKSGIYFVNTHGKQMFQKNSNGKYISSLMNEKGLVGGGQADLTQIFCDPTILFMAAALANVDKKLDTIQQMQQEMMDFLVLKDKSELKANLTVLYDILNNYQYNWDNEMFKNNNHTQVLSIKNDAEAKVLFFRERIISKINKKTFLHINQSVKKQLKQVQEQFEFYQSSLFILSFSVFMDVMLVGNFEKEYLDGICKKLEEYSYQYRELYTTCYNEIERYFSSSVESFFVKGTSRLTFSLGKAVEKIPLISKTQMDENLISAGNQIDEYGINKTRENMNYLIEKQNNFIRPFIDNINYINELYNQPTQLLIDKENLYIGTVE